MRPLARFVTDLSPGSHSEYVALPYRHPGVTPRIITDNGPQFLAKDFNPGAKIVADHPSRG